MAQNYPSVVVLGQVERIEGSSNIQYPDDADAWRIKVRLDSDGRTETENLPDAFPLLPKTLQSIPKKGEAVFVFSAKLNNNNVQRYYIGPIISQPQYQEYCEYNSGRGPAVSMLTTGKLQKKKELTSINRAKGSTKGSFPDLEDVALIGRGQEDVVLKYKNNKNSITSEVDLRAGIRLKPTDNSIKYLQGNVMFNTTNPSYIQVKYSNSGLAGLQSGEGDTDQNKFEGTSKRTANSIVNVVADKINLISHKDSNSFGEQICDKGQLVLEEQIDNIMSKLHRSVYGDELITLLKLIVQALAEHTHPYIQMPPTIVGTSLQDLVGYSYEKIISPNVRIS